MKFGVPLCCDGCGVVTATGAAIQPSKWVGKRVIINPGQGWDSHPDAAESETGYLTLGASASGTGTLQTHMIVDERDVFLAPSHLADAEAAALPTAGLTAWRALMVQSGNAVPGRNILVTGIGGGVALMAMQLALAAGCNVFVTSGSQEKLRRAESMGAKAGVLYTDPYWDKTLLAQLPKERKGMDAIIDGAGGDIMLRATRLLRPAGVVVSYGMTLGPTMEYRMKAVIRQVKLVGSTMGSRRDFADMLDCVRVNRIRPVVSSVLESGLDDLKAVDGFIGEMQKGRQFGKLVVMIENAKGKKALEIKL